MNIYVISFKANNFILRLLDELVDDLDLLYRSEVIRLAIRLLHKAVNDDIQNTLHFIHALKRRKRNAGRTRTLQYNTV